MFQKGTGERFKYKSAVKERFPKSVCKAVHFPIREWLSRREYIVKDGEKELSKHKRSAEEAWADAYVKHIMPGNP